MTPLSPESDEYADFKIPFPSGIPRMPDGVFAGPPHGSSGFVWGTNRYGENLGLMESAEALWLNHATATRGCYRPLRTRGMFVRCRQCAGCHREHRSSWCRRISTEIKTAPRTWFVTLTYRRLPNDDGYDQVQQWLKRVRKNSKERIRYVVATEYGSRTGRLHQHLAVHGEKSLKYDHVHTTWKSGLSEARLCGTTTGDVAKTARYIAKYLTKGRERVRASSGYGRGWNGVPF